MKDQTTKQASASQKPNILVRLLALLVTAALALGALTLVVYRDQFNLDAVKRWLALRSVETDASGAAAPFTHAGGDSISFAYLEGGILQCSAAGAHYYSFSGDQYAEEVTPLSQPVLSASSSAGVVYDAGGGEPCFSFRTVRRPFPWTWTAPSSPPGSTTAAGWLLPPSRAAIRAQSRCTTSTAPAGRRSSS